MELKRKTVLLTGATGGIGIAIARALDRQGAILLLQGRNEGALQSLNGKLGARHQVIVADINASEGRDEILNQCTDRGGLDLLVNVAGVMDFQLLERQESGCIETMVNTNLLSPMLLCQILLPLLRQRPEAGIVNVGSIFGSIGYPGFAAYCASKFGLRGFTEALRRELSDTVVKVYYLAPRATDTEFNSQAVKALNQALGNRTDDPQTVADELIRLVSGDRKQTYMGWPEKLFVRLNALLPNLVDSALIKKLPVVKQFTAQ